MVQFAFLTSVEKKNYISSRLEVYGKISKYDIHSSDNKFVQITTKSCLKTMAKYFNDNGQICRIYTIPHLHSDSKPLNSFFNFCKADELPNILIQPPTIEHKTLNDTWLQTPCKLCEKLKWSGERYTCLFCSNIVLCKECFYTGYHNEHPILCTRNNKLFSQKLLQCSRLAVASVPWKNTLPKVYKDPRNDERIRQTINKENNYFNQNDKISNNEKQNKRIILFKKTA
ncbi:hypothetical protein Smp_148290 [Schistosoma mansoni]|uniref:hypothetical protein n=1 Tax=Schistosoma mansoni TaxID=6183 RepID=UPI0001A631F2|nr:hypothetical protein Smp_148290 [Schistosoma mansoni]|eukprot:XP_018650035.1 hypothetical protein Smp_148290 [Schistosoma mansoni]